MHLPANLPEIVPVEVLVSNDDGQRRVAVNRARTHRGRYLTGKRPAFTGLTIAIPANDASRSVDEHAQRVDHRQDQDLCRSNLSKRCTLAGRLGSVARVSLSDGRGPAGAMRTQENATGASGAGRSSTERLVRVDHVPALAEVVDHGARDERDIEPFRRVIAEREQLGGDPGEGFETVRRPAGQADRVGPAVVANPYR